MQLQKYFAGRISRVVAGIAGTALGALFVVIGVVLKLKKPELMWLLFGTVWPLTFAAGCLGHIFAQRRARAHHGLEKRFELAGRTFSLEIRSIAWPLTGLAVLLPISAIAAFVPLRSWQFLELAARIFPWQLAIIYFSWRIARCVPINFSFVARVIAALVFFGWITTGSKIEPLVLLTTGVFALLWASARKLIARERRGLAAATEVHEQPERLRAIVLDEDRDDAARIMAMYTLARAGSRMHIFPVIDDALNANHAVSAAALDLARDLRHRPPPARLARNFYHGARRSAAVACELAADSRDPQLEQPLVTLLGEAVKSNDMELAVLAIRALATCGTIASVEVLRTARGISLISNAVRDAADDSINAIQARLMPHAAGGQLSLAEENTAAGAVSFPNAEAGALSPARSTSTGAS